MVEKGLFQLYMFTQQAMLSTIPAAMPRADTKISKTGPSLWEFAVQWGRQTTKSIWPRRRVRTSQTINSCSEKAKQIRNTSSSHFYMWWCEQLLLRLCILKLLALLSHPANSDSLNFFVKYLQQWILGLLCNEYTGGGGGGKYHPNNS